MKNLARKPFCHELDQILPQGEIYWSQDAYFKFIQIFSNLLLTYAPIEIKVVSGNQVSFMMKSKLKKVMEKTRIRKKYLKWSSR